VRRWIGLGLFLGIGMMRCVFGLDCSGFGVEIWILLSVPGEQLRRDEGSRARKKLGGVVGGSYTVVVRGR